MRAVDTNVLVRLITRDDPRQTRKAEAFVANGAWVSQVVLAETVWVLSSVYELGAAELATAVDMLLEHRSLILQDPETIAAALAEFRKRSAVGFTDCLVVQIARSAGHVPVGTFDRDLGKVSGAQRLSSVSARAAR
jgi:predicted nucleic-acid-binding protein